MEYESTVYRQPYRVQGMEDVPVDFLQVYAEAEHRVGEPVFSFFLPQMPWSNRRETLRQSPLIFRLTTVGLQILAPHVAEAAGPMCEIRFEQIFFYELSRSLLRSWFVLSSSAGSEGIERTYRFPTRWEEYFKTLTAHLDRVLLSSLNAEAGPSNSSNDQVHRLDPKFSWAVEQSLVADEKVQMTVFEPPQIVLRRSFRKMQRPGRCLCLTTKRLLWLEEEWEGQYLEYGIRRRTIPLRAIEAMTLLTKGRRQGLENSLMIRLAASEGGQDLRFSVSPDFGERYAQLMGQVNARHHEAVT